LCHAKEQAGAARQDVHRVGGGEFEYEFEYGTGTDPEYGTGTDSEYGTGTDPDRDWG
jgi:hypothetical protein